MYKKDGKRYTYSGDFEQYLLDIGVDADHIKRMKEKKLQPHRNAYYFWGEDDRKIKLVPLEKVIGASRGTVGDSVFENVRTMLEGEREPSRFNKCFNFLTNMSLDDLMKSYENLCYPVDMVYYKDDDEYYLSSDGNHRTLTAMLVGAQNIKAYVTVTYCDRERKNIWLN